MKQRYRVVEQVTVTCPPLNTKRCERLLRAQACALGADIIAFEPESLVGRRGLAQITQRARLVHFATD